MEEGDNANEVKLIQSCGEDPPEHCSLLDAHTRSYALPFMQTSTCRHTLSIFFFTFRPNANSQISGARNKIPHKTN